MNKQLYESLGPVPFDFEQKIHLQQGTPLTVSSGESFRVAVAANNVYVWAIVGSLGQVVDLF